MFNQVRCAYLKKKLAATESESTSIINLPGSHFVFVFDVTYPSLQTQTLLLHLLFAALHAALEVHDPPRPIDRIAVVLFHRHPTRYIDTIRTIDIFWDSYIRPYRILCFDQSLQSYR